MKKYLLLSIFGLLISISAYSQEIDEKVFPESDAIWVIHLYAGYGVQYIYGLTGDTIVNEKQYSKLYLLNDSTLNIDENDIYVGGIRQEDKKVYIQPVNKQDSSVFEEFLMYDFSKKIGEDVDYYKIENYRIDPWASNLVQIKKTIRTEEQTKYGRLLAFVERPIHNIIDYWLDCWLEGIGSLNGLFFPYYTETLCGGNPFGGILVCMKEKDKIRYLDEGCVSCFETKTASISEYQIIKIQPKYNPLNKTIELSDIESLYLPYTFSVINLEGKTLISYTIAESNTNINASHLHSGVYIYSLSGDNIKHTGKIIIQ